MTCACNVTCHSLRLPLLRAGRTASRADACASTQSRRSGPPSRCLPRAAARLARLRGCARVRPRAPGHPSPSWRGSSRGGAAWTPRGHRLPTSSGRYHSTNSSRSSREARLAPMAAHSTRRIVVAAGAAARRAAGEEQKNFVVPHSEGFHLNVAAPAFGPTFSLRWGISLSLLQPALHDIPRDLQGPRWLRWSLGRGCLGGRRAHDARKVAAERAGGCHSHVLQRSSAPLVP